MLKEVGRLSQYSREEVDRFSRRGGESRDAAAPSYTCRMQRESTERKVAICLRRGRVFAQQPNAQSKTEQQSLDQRKIAPSLPHSL